MSVAVSNKPFREYSIDDVQLWLQQVQNGKFASSASAFEGLDGDDLCTLTEMQMLKRCPKRGDVLFNLVGSLSQSSNSHQHHQSQFSANSTNASPSRDSSRHSSPVSSEQFEASSSEHTPVHQSVFLFPNSEVNEPPPALSSDPLLTSGFLQAPLPPPQGVVPLHTRRESISPPPRGESRLALWTHAHELHPHMHQQQAHLPQLPQAKHVHQQFQQSQPFVHRREASNSKARPSRTFQENPQVMVFIPRHWKASRTSAEINDKLTELFFGVGNGITIKSAPFSVHDFRVISFSGGWRDLFLRDRVLHDNGAGEDPALIFKCFGGYIKFKLYRA